ncbi:ABC transporter permease [bacterium]|jgi:peptide/nickel transport system permease protein|nr:ABC transporter permease [bacterium]
MPYLIKRLLSAIPLLIGITFISFSLMKLAPGDATSMYRDPSISQADIAQIRSNLGLDQPLVVQYAKWLNNTIHGNLGYSFVTGEPTSKAIGDRIGATLLLSCASFGIILVITFFLGLWSGYKKGSRFDDWVTIITFVGMSIPTFWLGLILILVFSLTLNVFPTSGYSNPFLSEASSLVRLGDIFHHMTLPLLTIVIGGVAGLTRYHRFGIISILNQDYIRAARARGISESIILFKHAFKNACLPIITILGLSLPGLISGSFVVEYIFAWPGLGQLGVQAVFARDYPIIMGTLLMSSVLIISGNLLADIAYAKIDPRIGTLS